MFCSNCGKKISEDVKFCPECGQQVGSVQHPQLVLPQMPRQPKSRVIAVVLCIFLGWFGLHDFYVGRNKSGLAKILITFILGWFVVGLIIVSLWCFFDLIHIAITDDDCFLTDREIEIKKQKQKDREEYYKRAQAEYEERMRELSGEE